MDVKLRKGQKIYWKILEGIANLKKNLAEMQNMIILRTVLLSPETFQYACLKSEMVSLANKNPYIWNKIKKFFWKNFLKNLKFVQKFLKLK